MNRNEIEERDHRTVEKIRSIIKQKDKPSARQTATWKKTGVWLPVLCAGLIVFGLIAFRQPSTTAVQDISDPPPKAAMANKESSATDAQSQADPKNPPADEQPLLAATENESSSNPAALQDSTAPQRLPSPDESIPPAGVETATNSIQADSEPPAESAAAGALAPSTGVQITHLVSCGGVRDKQFISAKSTFSVSADTNAMVWMRVLSKTPPFTLTHVYYLNGKHYCNVPLKIPYPHMRTWSKVTIDRDIHIGQWHVDVVAETGETLDQIEFTVVQ